MHDMSGSDCGSLRYAFCGKSQKAVSKLISSPSEFPRAFICDECVAVCVTIIEDDWAELEPEFAAQTGEPHPLLNHPLASEFMMSVAERIRHESIGLDASEELAQVRSMAPGMVAEVSR